MGVIDSRSLKLSSSSRSISGSARRSVALEDGETVSALLLSFPDSLE